LTLRAGERTPLFRVTDPEDPTSPGRLCWYVRIAELPAGQTEHVDETAVAGTLYVYSLGAVDTAGNESPRSTTFSLSLTGSGVVWAIEPGYPNPSRSGESVRIPVTLPNAGSETAVVDILDAAGRRVRRIDLGGLPPGQQEVVWDGRNSAGLMTVPGVGPVTAGTFVAVVDTVERFSTARQVRAYLGLVPREMSSGETQRCGHITKAGNSRMRSLFVEAAWSFLRSQRAEAQPLREWASGIAARRGKRIAAVALARKLAGVLFAIWRDGSSFGHATPKAQQQAA